MSIQQQNTDEIREIYGSLVSELMRSRGDDVDEIWAFFERAQQEGTLLDILGLDPRLHQCLPERIGIRVVRFGNFIYQVSGRPTLIEFGRRLVGIGESMIHSADRPPPLVIPMAPVVQACEVNPDDAPPPPRASGRTWGKARRISKMKENGSRRRRPHDRT